jgi:hypothetical protein
VIRGPSGSGKSTLARRLIDGAAVRGRFARLVSDDRVRIEARHGRLVARAVPAIAGRLEARGFGLLATPYEPAAVVRLLVDYGDKDPPRWPEHGNRATLEGVSLPCIAGGAAPNLADLILDLLRGDPTGPAGRPGAERVNARPPATGA